MTTEWRSCTLGDLLEVKHGFAFLGEYFGAQGTHVVLTPGNFLERGGFRQKGDKEKWYTGAIPPEYVLRQGDVLVAMTEQAEGLLGSSARVPASDLYLHNQRLGLIRVRPGVDLDFVYHLFNTPLVRAQIRASASGAKVRHTAPTRIAAVKIRVPGLEEQRRIAGILSAYDDLIENCERRIRVLDEMARALYREWFVLFRYPGHEKVPLVVGDATKKMPQGWAFVAVREITASISRGISPTYDDEGASIVINQKCIRDQRLNLSQARRQSKPVPAEKNARVGDVLINSTGVGTLGRAAQVLEEVNFTVDTHVTIVRPNSAVDHDFFGLTLLALEKTFESKGVGATGQTELSRTAIGDISIGLPTAALQRRFGALVGPMRSAALRLQRLAENLRKTRDLLLPRLLSGQLSLEKAA